MSATASINSFTTDWESHDQKLLEDSIIEMKPIGSSGQRTKKKRESILPIKDYESLDYDHCVNVPYKHWLESYTKFTYWHISFMRWVMVGLIGFFTGLTAYLINVGIYYLTKLKYRQFFRVYDLTQHSGTIMYGLLVLIGFNVVYALIAGILVGLEPIAAGSGIPEIKCYLNGVRMPRVSRVRTLLAKAVGVLFSVAGGFLVGKEGPMIHSGSIIGAGIPQLRTFLCGKARIPYEYFRSDRDKRDFVSCGAAAGVAAAFGAPIGGVLFSLEEGSSFWDQGLTWRSLFCAMCSTLTLNFFLSGTPNLVDTPRFGELDQPGLIDFGRFYQEKGTNFWSLEYLAVFVAMGAVGGLMGAWFNSLNKQLTKYRMKHVFRKNVVFKVMEAILIAIVTTVSVFILATFFGTCVPVLQVSAEKFFEDTTLSYFCPVGVTTTDPHQILPPDTSFGRFYNDMGTIVFNSQEDAIQELFHQNGAFTLATLGLTLIVYFFIACWTYGAGIPSGLFVPCLTIGALYGRFFITACWSLNWVPCIYPGTFALIGAAAFLGGVVRMTVSLTVILIESTDEIEYGLPLLVTLMVAKWVGDLFNEGLYDIHIELKEIPFLGWDSPENMNRLTAGDVMNTSIKYIYPITRVRSIERLLRVTAHSAFFVMSPLNAKNMCQQDMGGDFEVEETPMLPQLYERRSIMLSRKKSKTLEQKKHQETAPLGDINSDPINTPLIATTPINYQSAGQSDDSTNGYILHGIILRHQLVELLRNRVFFEESHGPGCQPVVDHMTLTQDYPRYKGIFDVHLTEHDRQMLMDVSVYMNPCPYTISHHASLPRVFNLFRTMGLRHLPVIEDSGIVVGMITRHDLTHQHLHSALHHKHATADHGTGEINDGVLDVSYRSRPMAKSIAEEDESS